MVDICHQVGIQASLDTVFQALTTIEGLSKWWTGDTRGDASLDGVIEFWFSDHCVEAKVIELLASKKVAWQLLTKTGEWVGTTITFELSEKDGRTFVDFKHADWQQATPLYSHCNTKWAVFLLSLKDYLEIGRGRPYPDDVQVNG